MGAHVLHLPHFHHSHHRLVLPWPKGRLGFDLALDFLLLLLGALLGMRFFVPGVLE